MIQGHDLVTCVVPDDDQVLVVLGAPGVVELDPDLRVGVVHQDLGYSLLQLPEHNNLTEKDKHGGGQVMLNL